MSSSPRAIFTTQAESAGPLHHSPPLPSPGSPSPPCSGPWPLAPGHPSVNTLPLHWGSDTNPAQPQWWQWYHQRTVPSVLCPPTRRCHPQPHFTKPKHAKAESPPRGTASRWQQRDLNLLSKVPLTDMGQGRHFSGFGHYCPPSPSPGARLASLGVHRRLSTPC